MKPLKLRRFLLTFIASMCLCSDIIYMPVHATPTDPGTGETTPDNGETTPDSGETTPDNGETTPDDGETTPDNGETTPDNGETPPEEEEPEYIPSSTNTLSYLEVEGFELSPSFSNDIYEYNLTINAGYEKIKINAGKDDYLSSVSGLGEFDVSWKQGLYDFEVTCTAENGDSRTFTIHLEVSSDPYIFAPLNGENLGFVVKGLDELNTIPQGFEQSVGSYGGKQITVFNNEAFPFSLVYLQKENKKQDWYCYQEGLVTGAFRKLVINKAVYYYAGVKDNDKKQSGYTYKEVTLTGEQLDGWKVKNNESKIMVYLYDAMGNADFYIYDSDLGTMQRRREYEVTETKENRSLLKSPVTITAIIIAVLAVVFGITFLKEGKKNHKKEGKKENFKEKDDALDCNVELVKTNKIKIYSNPEDSSDIVDLEIEKTKEFKVEDLNEKKEEVTSLIEEIVSFQDEEKEIESSVEKYVQSMSEEVEIVAENIESNEEAILPKEEVPVEELPKEKAPKKHRFFFKKNKKDVVQEEKVVEEKKEEVVEVQKEEYVPDIDEQQAVEEIKKYISDLFYSEEQTESN